MLKPLSKACLAGALVLLACAGGYPADRKGGPAGAPAAERGERVRRSRYAEASLKAASARAVLAYLRAPGPGTLKAALEACLAARKKNPSDVFTDFLIAFCLHEGGDAAGEERVLLAYSSEIKNIYMFSFHEHRPDLADALAFLPAQLCRWMREDLGSRKRAPKWVKCPGFGGPIVNEEYTAGEKTLSRSVCPKCDGMIRAREGAVPDGAVPGSNKENVLDPVFRRVDTGILDPARRAERGEPDPERLISLIGVKEGEAVADIGCGTGYFTFPLAARVGPKGRVYAEDIMAGYIELIRYAAEKGGYKNIVPVLGNPTDMKLPPGAMDKVALLFVYRDILDELYGKGPEYSEQFIDGFLGNIGRALKKGGVLAISDHLDPDIGLSVEAVAGTLEKRGFRLIADKSDVPERSVLLLFRKL